jgi:hypothetical protein
VAVEFAKPVQAPFDDVVGHLPAGLEDLGGTPAVAVLAARGAAATAATAAAVAGTAVPRGGFPDTFHFVRVGGAHRGGHHADGVVQDSHCG